MEERNEQLQQAAPGNNLDDMAAAGERGSACNQMMMAHHAWHASDGMQ
jgi:hypothetical protein